MGFAQIEVNKVTKYGRKKGHMVVKICPDCKLQGTLKKRDGGTQTEHFWCSECQNEKWADEIESYEYGIGSYINSKGERKYAHHNYKSAPEKEELHRASLNKARQARSFRSMSHRDTNLLKKIRGK